MKTKVSGWAPVRPSSPLSSALIIAMSVSSSSKSKISKFSLIRAGVVDFGKMMSPRCMCQRSVTWAAVLPSRSAIAVMVGSSRTAPWAIGDQASVAMPCSWP